MFSSVFRPTKALYFSNENVIFLRNLNFFISRKCNTQTGRSFTEHGGSPGRGKTVKMSVSSLRIDTIAAAGLAISRQKIWECSLDSHLFLNGKPVKKKSANVSEGDVIDVDTIVKGNDECDDKVARGRVEVIEIGERTRKGGYHVTLTRYKHFQLRKFISGT